MTDTDRIEELAKWFETRQGNCSEKVNSWHSEQTAFLRSLSTTIKDLREKEEALDNLLTFFDVTKYPDSLYAGCGFNLNTEVLHPLARKLLQKRLGKEGKDE